MPIVARKVYIVHNHELPSVGVLAFRIRYLQFSLAKDLMSRARKGRFLFGRFTCSKQDYFLFCVPQGDIIAIIFCI